jgi:hypothetical protein
MRVYGWGEKREEKKEEERVSGTRVKVLAARRRTIFF